MPPLPHFLQALCLSIVALSCVPAPTLAGGTPPYRQTLELGAAGARYPFPVFANADLASPALEASRAVVLVHGIARNAGDYFEAGRALLANARLSAPGTLLLAPNFLTPRDPGADPALPLWRRDDWMEGDLSRHGRSGIGAFQVLDDLLRHLADRSRFPHLREIVLVGHSAGAQLVQRHAAFSDLDETLRQQGIALRYVVASPSSYVYFDGNRPAENGFAPPSAGDCPDYDHYRYGLQSPPGYLAGQSQNGRPLFARYAARDITYVVGARDDDQQNTLMDKRCGARLQGPTRLDRQLDYLRYEHFLSERWRIPVNHRQISVAGVGHSPARLLGDPSLARQLFPSP